MYRNLDETKAVISSTYFLGNFDDILKILMDWMGWICSKTLPRSQAIVFYLSF